MDAAEGCNDSDDYFHSFLPDDAFNLFGEHDLNLDFTQFSTPNFEGANTDFEPVGQAVQEATAVDVNFQSSTRTQSNYLITSSGATIPVLEIASASTSSTLQSPSSKETMITDTTGGPESSSSKDPTVETKKRKLFIAFSATSGEEIPLRTRKPFSEQRRQVVAVNRVIGVCIQCKIKKVACDSGLPCERCIKSAGGPLFGQEICVRRSLVETRFNQIVKYNMHSADGYYILMTLIDLIDLASKKLLVTQIPTEQKNDDWAYIWFTADFQRNAPDASIKLPILRFQCPGFRPTRQFVSIDYYGRYEYTMPDSQYAICTRSIPSIESLLRVYLATKEDYTTSLGPFAGLYNAIQEFLGAYCILPDPIPLKRLLSKILHLQYLFDMYRTTPSMTLLHAKYESEIVSSRMMAQLRLNIGEAIVRVETDVLTQIDKLTQSREGIGRQNPLATWLCLWTLILSYKKHMIWLKAVIRRGGDKFFSLNQHIYNMLTSTYAALYNTTSPLTLDWRSKDVAGMLGNDANLINLFCNIKTEIFWFQADRDRLLPEDTLFGTLVVENESKLVTAHIKAAKRDGIL